MKSFITRSAINAFALFAISQLLAGVSVNGGLIIFLMAGAVLSVLSFFLKPILGIITLPFNLLTFGLFSFITNAFILYLLTVFIPQISISAFVFPGSSFAGFIIPRIYFNVFFAFIVSSVLLSIIASSIRWVIKD